MATVTRAAKSNYISKTTTLHVHQVFCTFLCRRCTTTAMSTTSITPFPSFKDSHFQTKAWCKIFLVKMSLNCMTIKNYFHINNFAINLALKQRLGASSGVLVSHLLTRFSFSSCQIEI